MSSIKCWQVDAFTDRPFGGNSAAVCFLEQEAPDEWMQAVAAEMNLSETAFVRRSGDGYSLRWFTPQVEVPLCGHATLASAHAIWSAGIHPQAEPIRFHTKSGVLVCQRGNEFIEMDFPAIPAQQVDPPPDLITVLGVSATYVGKTQFDHFVVVEDAETVRSMSPDFRRLKDIPTRGVIVTSRSDDARYDFVSRFFAPALGIDEDPNGTALWRIRTYVNEHGGQVLINGSDTFNFPGQELGPVVNVCCRRRGQCRAHSEPAYAISGIA